MTWYSRKHLEVNILLIITKIPRTLHKQIFELTLLPSGNDLLGTKNVNLWKKIWDIADLSIPTGNLHSNIAKGPRKVGPFKTFISTGNLNHSVLALSR